MIMRITVLVLVCSLTIASYAVRAQAQGCSATDQIAPSPNPVGSTITNSSPTACNGLTPFNNSGTLNNNGTLSNSGTMLITGIFNNSGTFNNDGLFTQTRNSLPQQPTGFVNTGTINNNSGSFGLEGGLRNEGVLNTYGSFASGDGPLFNYGTVNNYGWLLNACCAGIGNFGTLNNWGEIETREWGFGNTGVLNNAGTLSIKNKDSTCSGPDRQCGSLSNTGTLNNSGTFDNGGKLLNDGQFNNSGQFITDAKFVLGTGTYTQTSGMTRIGGSMTQTAININGGVLRGTGTITGAVSVDGGRVAPGNSPGILTIIGDYTQTMRGSFEAQIGGLLQGVEYDLLRVSGKATLAGLLDVSLIDLGNGVFSPHAGDTFDILSAETIIGNFSELLFTSPGENLRWDVAYLTDAVGTTDVVRLQVAAMPEPEIYVMLVLGLTILGWRARYMNRKLA